MGVWRALRQDGPEPGSSAATSSIALLSVSVVTALVLALAGCSGGEAGAGVGWAGSIDTVDGVVTVSNPTAPIWSREEAWTLEEDLTIGVAEGDPNYMFSQVPDIAVDDEGRIYVLDLQAQRVSVYDADGTFRMKFGRKGQGPGEFEGPGALLWKGDTLAVWDFQLRRLSYFLADGTYIGDADLAGASSLLGLLPGRFTADAHLIARQGPVYGLGPEREVMTVQRVDLGSMKTDTLFEAKPEESGQAVVRGDNFIMMFGIPYGPRLTVAYGPDGRIYVTRGATYEIDVYSPDGQRIRTIRMDYPPPALTGLDRDSAEAERERRIENAGPRAADVRKAYRLPDRKAAIAGLAVSDDGYLWVHVYTEDDHESARWDVLDPDGRYLGSLTAPARFRPTRIAQDAAYGIWQDSYDVPYVRRYVIHRPGRMARGGA